MDCPHCQGRFGAHVPGCSNAGKSSEHMEIEQLRDKIEKLEAENERLRNFVEESGDNLIRAGVLLNKDAIIADLEEYNIAQGNALEKLRAENERLTKIVDRLMLIYQRNPQSVAMDLDEQLDRSGNLLGWVRDAAMEGK